AYLAHPLEAVVSGVELRESRAHLFVAHPVGEGERRRGERVGDQVGGETAGVGDAGDVVEGRDDLAVGVPLRDEGAVDEGVLPEPEVPYSRGGEGEPDRAGPV